MEGPIFCFFFFFFFFFFVLFFVFCFLFFFGGGGGKELERELERDLVKGWRRELGESRRKGFWKGGKGRGERS